MGCEMNILEPPKRSPYFPRLFLVFLRTASSHLLFFYYVPFVCFSQCCHCVRLPLFVKIRVSRVINRDKTLTVHVIKIVNSLSQGVNCILNRVF